MSIPLPRRPFLIAMIVACAMFMEALDGTVITTALPDMARSLGSSPVHLSLAITSYMLSLAVFIPVSGWVADRYGARTVFRAAIVVFTIGSLLCGASFTLAELTAARILQGIGGAMMMPVGRLVLLRSVEKSELVRALAYLTVPAMIGPVIGPPLGGFITTYASWRWIFLLNLPVGVLGIVLVSRFIDEMKEAARPPLDTAGFGLGGASLTCLMTGLELSGYASMDPRLSWGLVALGLAFGGATIRHSRRHPFPLLDLSLLAVPTFGISVIGGSLFRIGIGALPFLVPLMLQVGFGMSAFASGILTFAAAVGSLAMKATASPVLRRYGFRTILIGNGAISVASLLACAGFTIRTPDWAIMLVLLAGGFFRALQFTALNAIAYADLPPQRMSAATSLYSAIQQVSLGAGVAVGALFLHLSLLWRGAAGANPEAGDFRFALLAVGVISLGSLWQFGRLGADAGAEVSGHAAPAGARSSVAASGD